MSELKKPKRPKVRVKSFSPLHKRFLEEYVRIGLRNATKAYLAIHPDATAYTAASEGHRLLRNPKIQAEIQAVRNATKERSQLQCDSVVKGVLLIANADPLDLFDRITGNFRDMPDIPADTRKAISSVKVSRCTTRTTTTKRGKTTTTETTTDRVIEYKLYNKLDANLRLCDVLGLRLDMPPIDVVLQILPRDKAAFVKGVLDGTIPIPTSDPPRLTVHENPKPEEEPPK